MESKNKIRVLMLGPDRSVHGGISGLVNGYYESGLDKITELKYIGTMKEGSRLKKLFVAVLSYFEFLKCVDNYDIIHVNVASDNSFRRKAHFIKCAKRHGRKIVIHQHGGDFESFYEKELDKRGRAYVRKIFGMGDVMLVLSKKLKAFFSQIVDEERIIILPNGINTDISRDDIKRDMNKIIFLGRICRDKGMDELIRAVSEIHDERPEVKLYLGGIFEEPKYIKVVEENKTFIEHIGWVEGKEKDRWLYGCGILVLPSYYEGFGLAAAEGMLHGCVTIGSSVGGIPEIIEDNMDGLLIPPRDYKALKKAIETVMDNQELADKLSCNGEKKVKEKFSLKKNIEILADIYRNLSSEG